MSLVYLFSLSSIFCYQHFGWQIPSLQHSTSINELLVTGVICNRLILYCFDDKCLSKQNAWSLTFTVLCTFLLEDYPFSYIVSILRSFTYNISCIIPLGTMIRLFKVKEKQRELAESANGKPPVKKQSAGELRLQKGLFLLLMSV